MSPAPMRPAEHELLLACARLHLSPAEGTRARRLAASADWDEVLALAETHRLIPFLHRHLREAPIPPSAAAELRARHRAGVHRSLLLAAELRRMLEALEAEGIPALAYKGPALAMQAYGDLSLRTFVDLDVLVRPRDVPRAAAVLAGEGYAPALAMSPRQERHFRRLDGDYPLVHAETGTLVELHARVSSVRFCMPVETEALVDRAVPVPIGAAEVRTLGDDDLLLVLCIHGAKHRWKRLEWVAAVAELLRAGRGDLDAVFARAAEVRARRTVLLGLEVARRLLDAPVPESVALEAIDDGGVADLADEAVERIFAGGPEEEGAETPANLIFNFRARDGAMDRARYAWRWAFAPTPKDWGWAHLPDALFPLYRVVRPVRLLLRRTLGVGG